MKRIITLCVLSLVVLMYADSSQAVTYNFPIDGLQEVPPVATPAFGTGIVNLVDQSAAPDDWALSWNITYSGLIGSPTLAHFHGPAPVGVNASPRVDIAALSGGPTSPIVGNTVISDAFATELMAGLWYVNVHSTFRTGGEIRGQVVPEPAALAMAGAGSLLLLRRRRRRS
jgi:hypothetical protein